MLWPPHPCFSTTLHHLRVVNLPLLFSLSLSSRPSIWFSLGLPPVLHKSASIHMHSVPPLNPRYSLAWLRTPVTFEFHTQSGCQFAFILLVIYAASPLRRCSSITFAIYRNATVRYYSQAEVAAASSSICSPRLYSSTTAILRFYRTLSLLSFNRSSY